MKPTGVSRKHMAQELLVNEYFMGLVKDEVDRLLKRLVDTDDPVETIVVRQHIRAYEGLVLSIKRDSDLDVRSNA